jgi:immunoglobulin-binding protein 1
MESAMRALRLEEDDDHGDDGAAKQDLPNANATTTTLSGTYERAERLAFMALGKPLTMASTTDAAAAARARGGGGSRPSATAHAGSDSDADDDGGDESGRAHTSSSASLPPDAAALAAIAAAQRAADAAHLFSRNEDADDIATSSLRFLLLPALRGLVLANARMPPLPPLQPGSSGSGNNNPPSNNPMAMRQRQVAAAEASLSDFLARVDQYGMLGSEQLARDYRRDEEAAAHAQRLGSGRDAAASSSSASSSSSALSRNPIPPAPIPGVLPGPPGGDLAAARTAKMERYRRARELERRVEGLAAARRAAMAAGGNAGGGGNKRRQQQQQQQQQQAESAAAEGEDGEPRGAAGAGAGTWDEQDERRYWAARLEQAGLEALDQRASLRQERLLLEHAASQQQGRGGAGGGAANDPRARREAQWQQERQRDRAAAASKLGTIADALAAAHGGGRGGAGGGAAGNNPLLSASALAALTNRAPSASLSVDGADRAALRQRALFTPYHSQPTMTIEEAGEEEMRDMQRREKQAAEIAGERQREKQERGAYCDEDGEEDDDDAVRKARAWDDWKDTHPFGYGNSQRNPCPPGQLRGGPPPSRLKKY